MPLATQQAAILELNEAHWTIRPGIAITIADLDERGAATWSPRPARGAQELVVLPPPEMLPWTERPHSAGWRRASRTDLGPWCELSAYHRTGGVTLRVSGAVHTLDGTRFTDANVSIPYFAPPPPHPRRRALRAPTNNGLRTSAADTR